MKIIKQIGEIERDWNQERKKQRNKERMDERRERERKKTGRGVRGRGRGEDNYLFDISHDIKLNEIVNYNDGSIQRDVEM